MKETRYNSKHSAIPRISGTRAFRSTALSYSQSLLHERLTFQSNTSNHPLDLKSAQQHQDPSTVFFLHNASLPNTRADRCQEHMSQAPPPLKNKCLVGQKIRGTSLGCPVTCECLQRKPPNNFLNHGSPCALSSQYSFPSHRT